MATEDKGVSKDQPSSRSKAVDHRLIEIDKPGEVAFWTKWFGVTEEELREAVRVAGNAAHNVFTYLEKTRRS